MLQIFACQTLVDNLVGLGDAFGFFNFDLRFGFGDFDALLRSFQLFLCGDGFLDRVFYRRVGRQVAHDDASDGEYGLVVGVEFSLDDALSAAAISSRLVCMVKLSILEASS